MNVIAKRTLIAFCERLPKSEQASALAAMTAWHRITKAAKWGSFADVKLAFNTADWVGDAKVVFNVGGNKYRIVCLLAFKSQRAFVLFVGTHREYDAVDVSAL